MSKIKLLNLLGLSEFNKLENHMKVVIDDEVEVDLDGNYLINTGYLRVSTDKQAEEGYGLPIQEAAIIEEARKKRFKNLVLFIDDGYTGTNLNRPGLKRLMSFITDYSYGYSKIRVNSMTIMRIDRLSRSLLGTLQFIHDYILPEDPAEVKTDLENKRVKRINRNKEAINFFSLNEGFCQVERNNPTANLMLTVFAALAEYDRAMIVEKMQKGKEARIASGKWMGGGNIPYGYRYDKKQGTLIIKPEEAAKVREIFRLYIEEGMSPQKIADRLGFKGEKIVTQILRRKSLTGCIEYSVKDPKDASKRIIKEVDGLHEPIISLERWEEAQEEIKRRSIVRGDAHYMLSGLLYCAECGAKMRYQKWNPKTGECKIVCYSQQKSKKYLVKDENCDNSKYWQSDIENAVIGELFRMSYLNNEEVEKTESEVDPLAVFEEERDKAVRELRHLIKQSARYENDEKRRAIYEMHLAEIDECNDRILYYENAIENEKHRSTVRGRVLKTKEVLRTLKDTWDDMTAEDRQKVCRQLIDRVEIHKDGVVDVHLHLASYLRSSEEQTA